MTDAALPFSTIDRGPFVLVGRAERYAMADAGQHIPAQWGWFAPRIPAILDRVGALTFGVCSDGAADQFTYLCAVETAGAQPVDADLVRRDIPALRYAVATHAGSVETLRDTIADAMTRLSASGLTPRRGPGVPDMLEVYGPDFDAQTGAGTIELWFPVAP